MGDDSRGAAMAVAAIVLGVTLVALLIGLSFVILSADDSRASEPSNAVAIAEPISDDPAVPYRLHYAWTWDEDDRSSEAFGDLVQCSHILIEAKGNEIDRGRLSEGLSNVDGDNLAISTAEQLNRTIDSTYVAVPIAYDYIQFLPAPSIIWIDDGEVRPVVLLWADEATAEVADPRSGIVDYGFSELSRLYDDAMRQAVCVVDRGYTSLVG